MSFQDIIAKMNHLDVLVNASELMVENELQRAMDINMVSLACIL